MAIKAQGTHLYLGNTLTPTTYTQIAEIIDMSGPSFTSVIRECTGHDSDGGKKKFMPFELDGGSITLKLNFLPQTPTHSYSSGLLFCWDKRIKAPFQLIFPDEYQTTWSFIGLVTQFSPLESVANPLQASCVIKLSGAPTLQ